MIEQPVFKPNENDIDRIIKRDYPKEQSEFIKTILNQYQPEKSESKGIRVKMDSLKLAAGDVEKLRRLIEIAKIDYRDVIGPAEYPSYPALSNNNHLIRKAIRDDWNQLMVWYKKE